MCVTRRKRNTKSKILLHSHWGILKATQFLRYQHSNRTQTSRADLHYVKKQLACIKRVISITFTAETKLKSIRCFLACVLRERCGSARETGSLASPPIVTIFSSQRCLCKWWGEGGTDIIGCRERPVTVSFVQNLGLITTKQTWNHKQKWRVKRAIQTVLRDTQGTHGMYWTYGTCTRLCACACLCELDRDNFAACYLQHALKFEGNSKYLHWTFSNARFLNQKLLLISLARSYMLNLLKAFIILWDKQMHFSKQFKAIYSYHGTN